VLDEIICTFVIAAQCKKNDTTPNYCPLFVALTSRRKRDIIDNHQSSYPAGEHAN
jgi:hypothetical protein